MICLFFQTKTIVSEGLDMSKGLVTGTVDAGKNLLHEGLDVLETIGKTTFDVIAEGDNGLKQTMKKNKVNLSQVLSGFSVGFYTSVYTEQNDLDCDLNDINLDRDQDDAPYTQTYNKAHHIVVHCSVIVTLQLI